MTTIYSLKRFVYLKKVEDRELEWTVFPLRREGHGRTTSQNYPEADVHESSSSIEETPRKGGSLRVMLDTPLWLALGIWGGIVILLALALVAVLVFVPRNPHSGVTPLFFLGLIAGQGLVYGISQIRAAVNEKNVPGSWRRAKRK